MVTFDYPHSRVFLRPDGCETRAPFVTETTGLTLMETKDPQGHPHVVVADIQARSPALHSGLNTFDEVLAIDGRQASQLGSDRGASACCRRAFLRAAATRLLVQSTIGKPRSVQVPLYDPLE